MNNLREIIGSFQFEIVVSSLAAVTIFALEQGIAYYSRMLRRIKKSPVLTPSRLKRTPAGKYRNDEVVLQGKVNLPVSKEVFYLDGFNKGVKIVNPRDDSDGVACFIPVNATFFNARYGPIENTNLIVNFAVNSFEIGQLIGRDSDLIPSLKPAYMLDSDQITVFGKYQNGYYKPHIRANCLILGGVDSMVKALETEIDSTRKLQFSLGIFPFYFAVKVAVNGILWLLNQSKTPRLVQSVRGVNKCAKCNNKKNVLLLDCMHFDLCFKCYRDLNFECSLCKRRMGYVSFVENNYFYPIYLKLDLN